MNKALAAILVIVLVAGAFVEEGDAVLRAGRDRIEKMQRALEEQREAPVRRGTPLCYNGGKKCDNWATLPHPPPGANRTLTRTFPKSSELHLKIFLSTDRR